jgi:hypothetical protein
MGWKRHRGRIVPRPAFQHAGTGQYADTAGIKPMRLTLPLLFGDFPAVTKAFAAVP